ncbi:TatD family hydrolase [Streptomyces sp. NRRL S-87]|uniref:TatD family hydrolase n=1 Tax=Streptomyces sp. NRRL S-87 TaxID=1463920 RepID=UPI000691F6F6|nr:TatD family hydrolase [Streptomyces sp. NRRL S-87]
MRIFDPHIHMTSRTTDDYEAMSAAGVRAVVEPSFWLGQPRTSPESFYDYFDALLGWEPFRAAQYGIAHYCTIALNPKEANDPRCTPVLDELDRFLVKDQVVAVGEIGYDSMTAAEDTAMERQLQLAADHGLPALVHTPHRDKLAGLRRTIDVVRASALDVGHALLDHLNEATVKEAKDSGAWLGFSVYPDTKMDEERMVAVLKEYGPEKVLVNSAADWGRSDPLKTRKVGEAMLAAGFDEDTVDRVLWRNPVAFYALSGRLGPGTPVAAPDATHEGNSILRGAPKDAPEDAPEATAGAASAAPPREAAGSAAGRPAPAPARV